MTMQLAIAALVSLGVGLLAGYALAKRRARALARPTPPPLYTGVPAESDDTRPTLVPFKASRDAGRKLAKLADSGGDALEVWLSESNKRR